MTSKQDKNKFRVGSFDVGINHLAFVDVSTKDRVNVKIHNLDLVSLYSENEKERCQGFLGTGKPCTNYANHVSSDEPSKPETKKSKSTKSTKSSKKSKESDENEESNEYAEYAENEPRYVYCKLHVPNEDNSTPINRVNTKNVKFHEISKRLNDALDNVNLKKCDKIVIEYQPKMASKIMQYCSHILYDEMVERYLMNPDAKCKEVSWAIQDKYGAYDGPKIITKAKVRPEARNKALKNDQYKVRKELLIHMAKYFMETFGETKWLEYFNDEDIHDKQDDISDAYVQGVTTLLGSFSAEID